MQSARRHPVHTDVIKNATPCSVFTAADLR